MKTPLQELIQDLYEIGKINQGISKSVWPLCLSDDPFYRGMESACDFAITSAKRLLPKEREIIEKSFLAGYISDNVEGPTTGEEFYNKKFGNEQA